MFRRLHLPPADLSRHCAAASVVEGTRQSMSSHADCADDDEADDDEAKAEAEADKADEAAADGASAMRRSPEAAAAAAVAFVFPSSPSVYLSAPRRT